MEGDKRFTICRLCLSGKDNLIYVFETKGILGYAPADVITELLRHDVSPEDKYPQCVCAECMGTLADFKKFKDRCEECKGLLDRAYASKRASSAETKQIQARNSWDNGQHMGNAADQIIIDTPLLEPKVELDEGPYWEPVVDDAGMVAKEASSNAKDIRASGQEDAICVRVGVLLDGVRLLKTKPLKAKTSAERVRDYRSRIRASRPNKPPKKVAKTALERTREWRERKKQLRKRTETCAEDTGCSLPMDDSRITCSPTEERGTFGSGPIKQENDSSQDGPEDPLAGGEDFSNPCAWKTKSEVDFNDKECSVDDGASKRTETCAEDTGRSLPMDDSRITCSPTEERGTFGSGPIKQENDSSQDGPEDPFAGGDAEDFSNPCALKAESEVDFNNKECSVDEGVSERKETEASSSSPQMGGAVCRKTFRCSQCGKEYVRQKSYDRHTEVHNLAVTLICDDCGKRFPSKKLISRHMICHSVEYVECKVCNKTLKHNKALTQHMAVHGEKNYKCAECNKCFIWRRDLKRHQTFHVKDEVHACDVCGKTFHNRVLLRSHRMRHEGGIPKKYSCGECDRKFPSPSQLGDHVRTHTGEKPFGCPHCGTRFALKKNLQRHVNSRHNKSKLHP